MAIQKYKKKSVFTPFITVRTPEEEKLSFGGDIAIIFDKKIDVSLTLDKIVSKAVTLKGSEKSYMSFDSNSALNLTFFGEIL